MAVFGKFTPFLEFKGPPTSTFTRTSLSLSVATTSNSNFPSSTIICSPTFTSFGKRW